MFIPTYTYIRDSRVGLKMNNQKILIVLAFFGLFCNILAADDEFYCKIEKTKKGAWQVCRRCNNINKDCDGTS